MRRVLTALALPLALATGALAEPDTLAVMDFSASNAPAGDAVVLSGFVRQAVVRTGAFTVVDKNNMDKILAEQAFQQTGCTSQECAVKLGKILNVKRMVVGEYTILDGTRFLTASLVEVESGKIEKTAKVKGFQMSNADGAADDLAGQIAGTAPVAPVQPAAAGPVAAPLPATRGRGRFSVGPAVGLVPMIVDLDLSRFSMPDDPLYGGHAVTVSPPTATLEHTRMGGGGGMSYRFPVNTAGTVGLTLDAAFVVATTGKTVTVQGTDAVNGKKVELTFGQDASLAYATGFGFWTKLGPVHLLLGGAWAAMTASTGSNKSTYRYTDGSAEGELPSVKGMQVGGFALRGGAEIVFTESLSLEVNALKLLGTTPGASDSGASGDPRGTMQAGKTPVLLILAKYTFI